MRVTRQMIERGAGPLQDVLGLHAVEARGLASRVLHAAHDEPLETDADRQMDGQTAMEICEHLDAAMSMVRQERNSHG